VLVMFHGPHAYVSPSWYADPQSVPTWNYAVVHAHGRAALLAPRPAHPVGIVDAHERRVRAAVAARLSARGHHRPAARRDHFWIVVERLEGKLKRARTSARRPARAAQRLATSASRRRATSLAGRTTTDRPNPTNFFPPRAHRRGSLLNSSSGDGFLFARDARP
jgi:transcriptional regulator